MKDKMISIAVLFARLFIGVVFFYSGFTKLLEPHAQVVAGIVQYEVIPVWAVPLIAALLPWIEFLLGSYLILGYATRPSALVAGCNALGFIAVLLVNFILTGSFPEDCGCFGESSFVHFSGLQILILDIISLTLALLVFFSKRSILSLDQLLSKKPRKKV